CRRGGQRAAEAERAGAGREQAAEDAAAGVTVAPRARCSSRPRGTGAPPVPLRTGVSIRL
ncbi:hypothetical protein ACWD4T_39950, partial [Streptomyces umbrinus]